MSEVSALNVPPPFRHLGDQISTNSHGSRSPSPETQPRTLSNIPLADAQLLLPDFPWEFPETVGFSEDILGAAAVLFNSKFYDFGRHRQEELTSNVSEYIPAPASHIPALAEQHDSNDTLPNVAGSSGLDEHGSESDGAIAPTYLNQHLHQSQQTLTTDDEDSQMDTEALSPSMRPFRKSRLKRTYQPDSDDDEQDPDLDEEFPATRKLARKPSSMKKNNNNTKKSKAGPSPAKRQKKEPSSPAEGTRKKERKSPTKTPKTPARTTRKPAKNNGRRCAYCNATQTPMWRHGPAGYTDLCNKV